MKFNVKGMIPVVLAALGLLAGADRTLAATEDTPSEIENLKQRIQTLEAASAWQKEVPFALLTDGKHLEFSGLLAVEASYAKTAGETAKSDLTLATAQLSAAVTVNENIGGHLVLLYEEEPGEDSLLLDEAAITLHCPNTYQAPGRQE